MELINKKTVGEVHFQLRVWTNMLTFYKEELNIFQKRLEEMAVKNNSQDVHVKIEQFQNRFIIQKNEIDELQHLININEDKAVSTAKINIRRLDDETSEQQISLEDSIDQFKKLYKEMKLDFYLFLSKWM